MSSSSNSKTENRHEAEGGSKLLSSLERTEGLTNRRITIATDPNDSTARPADNPQEKCPLFRLPRELRDVIWKHATAPYDDPTQETKQLWRHPDRQKKQMSCTALLSTCRDIWLEANSFCLSQATLEFRAYLKMSDYVPGRSQDPKVSQEDRRVRDNERDIQEFLRGLTLNNRRNLNHVQVIGDWQGTFGSVSMRRDILVGQCNGVCPRVLSILVRNANDMGGRVSRSSYALSIMMSRLAALLQYKAPPRLGQIRLELEYENFEWLNVKYVIDEIKGRFEKVVREASDRSRVTLALDDSVESRMWVQQGETHPYLVSVQTTKRFVVKTLVWNVVPVDTVNEVEVADAEESDPLHNLLYETDTSAFLRRDRCLDQWKRTGSLLRFAPARS